jgi:hypothetical protein
MPSGVLGGKNSKEKDLPPASMRSRTEERVAGMPGF